MKLAVSEVFYSIQGEGITTGYPAVFLRLGGCNLMCGGWGTQTDGKLYDDATWRCDSIEVWMKSKGKQFIEIFNKECFNALQSGAHLIITGGEPLMQQQNLVHFIDWLRDEIWNCYIEVETNGTIVPSNDMVNLINQWNCSPKLSNSGMTKESRINPEAISKLNKYNTIFKFVIGDKPTDWEEVVNDYMQYIDKNKIWLMPAGSNKDELEITKNFVAEICKANTIKFTNRLHIEIWNKKTGV